MPSRNLPLLGILTLIAGLATTGALLSAAILRESEQAAAHVGDTIEIPGGLLRVDRVTPEHMAPMQMYQFGKYGMTMSGMGIDVAPEGYRRFFVEVALASQAREGLRLTADKFWVTGEGMPGTRPLRQEMGDGLMPAGSRASVNLTFQIPKTVSNVRLHFEGGRRAVALELAPDTGGHDHSHSQPESGEPHAHDE